MKVMSITGRSARDPRLFRILLDEFRAVPPEYFQVRDKEATDRALLALLRQAREELPETRVLANARFDLALASGAAGVVLPADGLPLEAVRRETPRGFLVGKSTHSASEAAEALEQGADLVLLGPVFDTPSKRRFGPPLGPEVLRDLPEEGEVLAVGGIDLGRLSELAPYRPRLSGIAAIRLFEDAADPSAAVEAAKRQ
jgi:thiamine-phosphate pyrophosphorylase